MPLTERQLREWVANALLLLGSVVFSLVLLEGAVEAVLRRPSLLPSGTGPLAKPLTLVTHYYKNSLRRIVQYVPECAQYDPELTYTLMPGGTCRVVNRDHDVEYSANRAGLRDTEEALEQPELVVLGDSHAMGSAVDADAAFPGKLGRELGRRVLNAGVSSFGTVRQLALLKRLDLPPFETLVIQYCENDAYENSVYVDDGALRIVPKEKYDALVDAHLRATRYYPFKHARTLLEKGGKVLGRRTPARPGSAPDTDMAEARNFLEVLLRHRELIEGKKIVVLELNGYKRDDGKFIAALGRLLEERRYTELAQRVTAVDPSLRLEPGDYFVLDGHMRPRGHAKVARLLAEELSRASRPSLVRLGSHP